jgi:hypothetical protein
MTDRMETSRSYATAAPAADRTALELRLTTATRRETIVAEVGDLIICGWAGRDMKALMVHAEELAALGVAPPTRMPCHYRVSASLMTTAASIQVLGSESSGEVEPVLIGTSAGTLVSVGSDHTDRRVESYSIAVSKQLCEKPFADEFWLLDDVRHHWDTLIMRAFAVIDGQRVLYQESPVSILRPVDELVADYLESSASLPSNMAMFCGTCPAIGGIRPASRFEISLSDPVLKRSISHAYDIVELPVVS